MTKQQNQNILQNSILNHKKIYPPSMFDSWKMRGARFRVALGGGCDSAREWDGGEYGTVGSMGMQLSADTRK